MSKVAILIVLLAMAISSSGCKDDQGIEVFTMNQTFEFTIQSGLNTQITHFFFNPSVISTFDEQLAATGRTADEITGVYPGFSELATIFKDEDLDFISRIEVRMIDPLDPEYTREVFYLDPVPANTNNIIRPFPGLANVKDLVSLDVYALEVRLIFRRIPTETLDMRLDYELSVRI